MGIAFALLVPACLMMPVVLVGGIISAIWDNRKEERARIEAHEDYVRWQREQYAQQREWDRQWREKMSRIYNDDASSSFTD